MNGTVEIFKDAAGGFRWRLKAGNGEIVAQSESYTTKQSAKSSAENLQRWAASAKITEV